MAWALGLCLALSTIACRDQAPRGGAPSGSAAQAIPLPARQPVDVTLMAFLSKARAANHAADLALQRGDRRGAILHLRRLTEGARPTLTPEVREVLADAHARLADLLSEEGEHDVATDEILAGLSVATETTLFRANLYMVWGLVEERRMEALTKANDPAGAEDARLAALEAFEWAMTLQERVLEQALAPPPGR